MKLYECLSQFYQKEHQNLLRSNIQDVPQGSLLGPFLFAKYTSSLLIKLRFCDHHLYADDIQQFYSFKQTDSYLRVIAKLLIKEYN